MNAPDPLECMAVRAAHDESLCNEPESEHCKDCELCPGACVCPSATEWKKGDRVRITFDAVYLTEPSIKPGKYALVVLPGTDLDGNVLLMDRFRVPLAAMTRLDGATSHDDEQWLNTALDAYAKASGVPDWAAYTTVPEDLDEANLGGTYRAGVESIHDLIAAATAPLRVEIRRLTAEVENLKHSKETS